MHVYGWMVHVHEIDICTLSCSMYMHAQALPSLTVKPYLRSVSFKLNTSFIFPVALLVFTCNASQLVSSMDLGLHD